MEDIIGLEELLKKVKSLEHSATVKALELEPVTVARLSSFSQIGNELANRLSAAREASNHASTQKLIVSIQRAVITEPQLINQLARIV